MNKVFADQHLTLLYNIDMAWKSIEKRKEYYKKYCPKWRKNNPEKVKQYQIISELNPNRKIQKKLAGITYRGKNAERLRQRQKKWRIEHKDYINFMNKQRQRNLRNLGKFTFKEWIEIKEKYNFCCPCCKKFEPDIKLTIDHIKPISKGGLNIKENIQPLCNGCNIKKYTKEIYYACV